MPTNRRLRHLLVPALLLIWGGCGREDRLVLEADGVSLRYSCGEPRTQVAAANLEQALVKRYATRIVQHANDASDMGRVAELMTAYDANDFPNIERLVVDRLCAHPEEIVREPKFPEPGSPAPRLDLQIAFGGAETSDTFRIPDPQGRYVLVDFWASWCGPCTRKYPKMIELVDEYSRDNVVIVGVLHREVSAKALAWLEENGGVRYAWLADPDSRAAKAYGIYGIPRMFLIDPQGRLVDTCTGCQVGSMSPDTLLKSLRTILN